MHKFICEFVVPALDACHEDEDLVACLIEWWDNFKKFCHLYLFLFKVADNYY